MSTRIEGLEGDLRFNRTQIKLITRDLAAINNRIFLIEKDLADAKAMEAVAWEMYGEFSLFDVD